MQTSHPVTQYTASHTSEFEYHLQPFSWTPFYKTGQRTTAVFNKGHTNQSQTICKHLNTQCTTDAVPNANDIIYTHFVIIQQSIKKKTRKKSNQLKHLATTPNKQTTPHTSTRSSYFNVYIHIAGQLPQRLLLTIKQCTIRIHDHRTWSSGVVISGGTHVAALGMCIYC